MLFITSLVVLFFILPQLNLIMNNTMKKSIFTILLSFSIAIAIGQVGGLNDIFFSEYIEGSGNNKALEIFNPTDTIVSLDSYIIRTNYNGNPWNSFHSFPIGASIGSGDVWIIANSSADAGILNEADEVFAYNQSGFIVGFNGNDARGLFKIDGTDTILIDIIGNPLENPSAGWNVAGYNTATKNNTLVRKPNVIHGNPDWAISAGTTMNNSEWLVYNQDELSFLGGHSQFPTSSQSILLPTNWSIFSTYLQPLQPNIVSILNPILTNVLLAKSWNGDVYWPAFGVNQIGENTIGHGYQIKMSSIDTLLIDGGILQPDTIEIIIPNNWSILGYLRTAPASIVDMLAPIYSNIVVVKDWNGQPYWPQYGVNLIGDMQPGQGYSIKLSNQDTLVYPANAILPDVTTTSFSTITDTSAVGGGNVINDGGAVVLERGICWNTSGNPTIADSRTFNGPGIGIYTSTLTNLSAATTYYVKAYATNIVGTAYGNELQLITSNLPIVCPDSIGDYDGNYYSTVLIGTQCWMAENIAVTNYSNGTAIPNVTINSYWGNLDDNNIDDAYAWYDNDTINMEIYGALYTWAAAMGGGAVSSSANPSGVLGVCPTGWHLPSENEFKQLEIQLGMDSSVVDLSGWRGTDQGSQLAGNYSIWNNGVLINNAQFGASGFNAIPGGYRYGATGQFFSMGISVGFWSSTEVNTNFNYAWSWSIIANRTSVSRLNQYKSTGFYVRCVMD